MTEFTKDYTALIKEARENGDSDRVSELTRAMDMEAFLNDENLQRKSGERAAEHMNAKSAGMGKKI